MASTSFSSESDGTSTADRPGNFPPLLGNPLAAFLSYELMQDIPVNSEPLFPTGDVYSTCWATCALRHQEKFHRNIPMSQRLGHFLDRHRHGDWGDLPTAYHAQNTRACSSNSGRVISCFMLETRHTPYFGGLPLTPLVLLSDMDYGLTVAFAVTNVELRHLRA